MPRLMNRQAGSTAVLQQVLHGVMLCTDKAAFAARICCLQLRPRPMQCACVMQAGFTGGNAGSASGRDGADTDDDSSAHIEAEGAELADEYLQPPVVSVPFRPAPLFVTVPQLPRG